MSLVGSLEDLNLGDILQIISLSQKSGVLALKTSGCDGRIVFVDGLVRGAAIKGGPEDLRGVLVGGGFMSEDEFAAAAEHAASRGCSLPEAVAEVGSLTAERVESLCREAIESAVITMFSWTKGDFSFDVRSEPAPGDPELLAPNGVNAQYLAMEGARLRDEDDGHAAEGDDVSKTAEVGDRFDEMSAHEMFGVTPDAAPDEPTPPSREAAVDALAMAGIDKADGPDLALSDRASALAAEIMALGAAVSSEDEAREDAAPEDEASLEPAEPMDLDARSEPEAIGLAEQEPEDAIELIEPDEALLEPASPIEEAPEAPAESAGPAPEGPDIAAVCEADGVVEDATHDAEPADGAPLRPLVVIDRDLVALEWTKDALKDEFEPIHIFQQTEQAMARIRQYLVRGEAPVVLVAPDIDVDHLAGVVDPVDFVSRLKAQSPRIVALWLREEGAGGLARVGAADGSVVRPDGNRLRAPGAAEKLEEVVADFARQVRIDVSGAPGEGAARERPTRAISPDAIRRLRDATRALTEASSRGEVLPLVIRFASEVFGRVAMFMVRDGTAVGMAQHGLPAAGGPEDRDLRELAFPCGASSWLAMVLEQGKPVRGAPGNDGDRDFASLLGDRVPAQAYVAPIESTGQVIALLYGDNLPEDGPLGDTSALEVVLHHAGLALDRAALERALREGSD
jgi:hypothetical protein